MQKFNQLWQPTWAFIRQVLSIRGLLDWIDWKQPVGAALTALGVSIWSYVYGLPGPALLALGIVSGAFLIVGWRAVTLPAARHVASDDVPVEKMDKPGKGAGLAFGFITIMVLVFLAGRQGSVKPTPSDANPKPSIPNAVTAQADQKGEGPKGVTAPPSAKSVPPSGKTEAAPLSSSSPVTQAQDGGRERKKNPPKKTVESPVGTKRQQESQNVPLPPPTFSVTSNNQAGGLTAGQVNVNAIVPVAKISTAVLFTNQLNADSLYETQMRVTIGSPVAVPELFLGLTVPSLVSIIAHPEPKGRTAMGMGYDVKDGHGQQMIMNAFGSFLVTVLCKQPEKITVGFACRGITCQ